MIELAELIDDEIQKHTMDAKRTLTATPSTQINRRNSPLPNSLGLQALPITGPLIPTFIFSPFKS
jgi:hypothetical protein